MNTESSKRTWWMPPIWAVFTSQLLVLFFGFVAVQAGSGMLDNSLPHIFGWRQNWKSVVFPYALAGLVAGIFNIYSTIADKEKVKELKKEAEEERLKFSQGNVYQIREEIKQIADVNPNKWTPELVTAMQHRLTTLCCDFLEKWGVDRPRVSFYMLSAVDIPTGEPDPNVSLDTSPLHRAATTGREPPRRSFFRGEKDYYSIFDVLKNPDKLHTFTRKEEELRADTDPITSLQESPTRWERCARIGVKDVRFVGVREERKSAGVLVADSPSGDEFSEGAAEAIRLCAELLSLTLLVGKDGPSKETLQGNFAGFATSSSYDKGTRNASFSKGEGGEDE